MIYSISHLSPWEKITFGFVVLLALGNGLLNFVTAPFRGSSGSAKVSNHIKIAVLRTFIRHTTVRQMQAVTPTVEDTYTKFAKKEGFTPASITCPGGTNAFWMGDQDAEKVVLWFHGGGYILPATPGHFTFLKSIVDSAGGKVALLIAEYSLAPYDTYPQQLREGVELVRYVCSNSRRKAQDVTIAGDSAGANLCLGILSHLLHPHPEIPPLRLEGDGKLGAAILLSPWVSFRTDWPSGQYNAKKDVMSVRVGDLWRASFLGGKARDEYNEPLAAEEGWWKGVDRLSGKVLVCGGADEVFVDCIRELAKRFDGVHPNVTTVIAEGECHDMPVVSALGQGGEQSEAIKAFLKSEI